MGWYKLCKLAVLALALSVEVSLVGAPNSVLGDPKNHLRSQEFIQNAEHVQEHLKGQVDFDMAKATPRELEWHFFKLHDTDGNKKLDGLEILKALEHGLFEQTLADSNTDLKSEEGKKFINEFSNYLVDSVDMILKQDDRNNDGYLSYHEYRKGTGTDVLRPVVE